MLLQVHKNFARNQSAQNFFYELLRVHSSAKVYSSAEYQQVARVAIGSSGSLDELCVDIDRP
jgi:hypothetical protein